MGSRFVSCRAGGQIAQHLFRDRGGFPPEVLEHFGRTASEVGSKIGEHPGTVRLAAGEGLGSCGPAVQARNEGKSGRFESQFRFALDVHGDAGGLAGGQLPCRSFARSNQIDAVVPDVLHDAVRFDDSLVLLDLGDDTRSRFQSLDDTDLIAVRGPHMLGGIGPGDDFRLGIHFACSGQEIVGQVGNNRLRTQRFAALAIRVALGRAKRPHETMIEALAAIDQEQSIQRGRSKQFLDGLHQIALHQRMFGAQHVLAVRLPC